MTRHIMFFILILIALSLYGCSAAAVTQVEEPPVVVTEVVVVTATDNPLPSPTQIPPSATPAPVETEAPAETQELVVEAAQPACLSLLAPADGEWVRAYGLLSYEWEPWPEAATYRIAITVPNGWVMELDQTGCGQKRQMESLPEEGEYTWQVSALGADGEVMCTSQPFTFNKQASSGAVNPSTSQWNLPDMEVTVEVCEE